MYENIFRLCGYICSQKPSSSFYIFNRQFFICSRCFGIYCGLIIFTLILFLFLKKRIKKIQLTLIIIFSAVLYFGDIYLLNSPYLFIKYISGLSGGILISSLISGGIFYYNNLFYTKGEKK